MKKPLIIIVLLVIAALFLYISLRERKGQMPSTTLTIEVKEGNIEEAIYETGIIEPVKKVEIKSKIGGEIARSSVAVGDRVNKGDVLALIDSRRISLERDRELKEAEYTMLEINSVYLHSKDKLGRNQRLFEKKMINAQEFEDLKKEHDVALVKIQAALKKWELLTKEYEERLNDYVITSPLDGIVIEKSADEGEVVSAGTVGTKEGSVIMVIADKRRLVVRSKINETNINRIKTGQPVRIHVDAAPGKVYDGKVMKISNIGKAEHNVVTFEVLTGINDADNQLKPGMTARIDVITGRKENVLMVPVNAVYAEGETRFVSVQGKSGFEKREVVTGISDRINIEIISGLNKGEIINNP